MYWRTTRSLLFLVLLVHFYIAESRKDTCGAEFKGVLFEDFHGGHSFEQYDIDPHYTKEKSLTYQDRICTNIGKQSATIAKLISTKNLESILLEISNGQVSVQLMHNGEANPECIFTLSKTVNDGSNHLIQIEIKWPKLNIYLSRKDVSLYRMTDQNITTCLKGSFSSFLNIERGGEKVASHGIVQMILLEHRKYMGKPHLYGNFDGCMGDSMINGIPLAKAGNRSESYDVDAFCHHTFLSDCTNVCPTSYIRVAENQCSCSSESEINDFGLCAQSCECITCENGGNCFLELGGDVVCVCAMGYKGKRCEEKEDLCEGFKCYNNGSCKVQQRGRYCDCLPQYTGIQCEVIIPDDDPCRDINCLNNGTCQKNETNEEKVCNCPGEFQGKFCENKKNQNQYRWNDNPVYLGAVIVCPPVLLGLIIVLIKLTCNFVNKRRQGNRAEGNGTTCQSNTNCNDEEKDDTIPDPVYYTMVS